MNGQTTELYEKLSQLQWLLQRHHMMNHAARGPFADATRGQGRVLAMLKIQPGISTKDLSYLLGIKIASLNELLNKLEKGGYIVREPSEADKRVMLIYPTEKARSAQQDAPDHGDIFNCLGEAEQKAFGDYLERVIGALEARVGSEPDDDERENWMRAMRERMGNERFAQMMSMRRRFGGCGPGFAGIPGAECFHPGYPAPKGPHAPDDPDA